LGVSEDRADLGDGTEPKAGRAAGVKGRESVRELAARVHSRTPRTMRVTPPPVEEQMRSAAAATAALTPPIGN
jgi:predicted RecB family endonuclease